MGFIARRPFTIQNHSALRQFIPILKRFFLKFSVRISLQLSMTKSTWDQGQGGGQDVHVKFICIQKE